MNLIVKDGVLYFVVVFASSLAWTITNLVLQVRKLIYFPDHLS
jgi:hypothetical protein